MAIRVFIKGENNQRLDNKQHSTIATIIIASKRPFKPAVVVVLDQCDQVLD